MKRVPAFLVILIFCLVSCKKSNVMGPSVTDKSTVSEYSPMVLSVKDEFFVKFAKNYISEEEINTEVSADLFSVEPNVAGKAIWEDRRTIVFMPTDQWSYDSNYKFFVDTDKMFGSGKTSMITFKTSELSGNLTCSPMQVSNVDNKSSIVVKGSVTMSDYVDPKVVEESIAFSQKNNDQLDIRWEHSTASFKHSFTIVNVKRFEGDSEVFVKANPDRPIVKFNNDEQRVFIPTIENFSFIGAKLPSEGAKYIELSFSDMVDKRQNLDGLIRLKGSDSKLKIDIDKNVIKIYPTPFPSENTSITISENIQSTEGRKLKKEHIANVSIVPAKPQVKFISEGNILPHVGSSALAFETKALNAVDVEIFKIYENNLQEFFQSYEISRSNGYRKIGDVVYADKLDLNDMAGESQGNGWSRYALNLDYFSNADPAAIYEVRLGFRKEYSTSNGCKNEIDPALIEVNNPEDMNARYYSYPDMEWEHYKDPCYPSYYTSRNFVSKNILVSNLGLVAKAAEGKGINIYASDIRTAKPLTGVTISFYSQSKQLISNLVTDSQGMTYLEDADDVFFVVGKNEREYSYVTIMNNRRLKTSQFDVSGVDYQKGINGFLYGERGVWRPGDTIFLSMMVEDKENALPSDHPVKLNVFNSKGVLHTSTTKLDNVDGLYVFPITTSSSDPTGNWRAEATVGNHTFRKQLKVETIKPNRLKINHDRANEKLYDIKNDKIRITSKWLHGAPSSGLTAKVEANFVNIEPEFENYKEFDFNDPARRINNNNQVVFDGPLDDSGEKDFKFSLDRNERFPGNIKANLNTRVFEKSGNFSNYYSTNILYPYQSYAGVKLPKSRWGRNYISSTTSTEIEFVNVDAKGKPKANRKMTVGIYEARWSWWYNRSDRNMYKYNSDKHLGAIETFDIVTDAQGIASYETDFGGGYGNYMIRVCDVESGHCSGEMFYTGSWGGSSEEDNSMTKLNITKNETSYKVDETVKLSFPSSENANILITVESVNGVIQSEWIPSQGEKTEYSFTATKEMLPNIYVNVNMIQTWERDNDLPIRMYGIIPVEIKDPDTELNPIVASAEVFAPNSKVNVSISEMNGKDMAYTITMVDEGLLDLTNFKTPKPHGHFYAKQALGVRTWDMYDDVINKNGEAIEKIISVGGDGENLEGGAKKNANRFIPVVHFDGPFYLESGATAQHNIQIPNYMGSVKIMVVAKKDNSYGNAHKVVPVKKELMLLSTFPRVLTLGDQLSIPVNTFWTEDKPMDVSLNMETNDMVIPVRSTSNTRFEKAGDQISTLVATVKDKEGIAEFRITGVAGPHSSFEEVEIDVRNPNPVETEIKDFALQAGESVSETVERIGVVGNQATSLEVSRFPSLNLEKRLGYLVRYPYGCLEQTVSAAFPQLYLAELTELPDFKEKEIKRNITRAIQKLRSYQRSGRFNYWRSGSYYHVWSDVYAAHFLYEAEQKGYFVGSDVFKNWVKSHQEIASQFDTRNADSYLYDVQAYRLYVLAISGNANTGAMNRLRGVSNMSDKAKYLLAAAYGRLGQASVGKTILENVEEIKEVKYDYYSFSSTIRDEAIAAMSLTDIELKGNALILVNSIAEKLRSSNWYSTHSIAYSLMAVAKVASVSESETINYSYSINGSSEQSIQSENVLDIHDLAMVDQSKFTVSNTGSNVIYVSVINSGKRRPTSVPARNENLKISVNYYDEDGATIDHKNLKQGTDFKAVVKIVNPGTASRRIEDLALSQIFPAGWEIRSGGLSNEARSEKYQFQEVRDDRVNTFFEISTRNNVVFEVKLTASFVGDFYLPPTTCESMYNNRIHASTSSNRVKVIEK